MAFVVPGVLTSPEGVYAAIILLIVVLFILSNLCVVTMSFLSSCSTFSVHIRPFILSHIVYARFNCHFLGFHGISRLHVVLGALYFLGTGVCNVIHANTLAKASSRAAHLCLINLTPMYIAGTQEFGARLLGISLHTYRSIHRTFSYVAVIEATIHVIIMARIKTISWSDHLDFYGLLASSTLLSLIILPLVKKRVYEVFLITHVGSAVLVVYAVWQHVKSAPQKMWLYPLVYVCLFAISSAMQTYRILYRNIVIGKAPIRLTLETYMGDVARMTLVLPRPWNVRAGERVSLGIPQIGILYLFQSHPFTICWWQIDRGSQSMSICLLFRPRSGFTRRVLERMEPLREYGAWLDGPFGPSSISGFNKSIGDYGHILMVATGIGIAAQIPYIKEILEGHHRGIIRTQRVSLIWQLDRHGDWESARDWLQDLVKQDNGYMLYVTVYDQLSSVGPTQRIGRNGLITVHSGLVDWEEQVQSEMQRQIGTLLVTVSARRQVRRTIRDLVRARTHLRVRLLEQEFQPWGLGGRIRAILRP